MKLRILDGPYTICKLKNLADAPLDGEFVFIAKTDEEISLVCRTGQVPGETVEREDGWVCFGIIGQMEFNLVGVIAGISAVLAAENIGIFVVSTYNTDYILVKEKDLDQAVQALERSGYSISR